LAGVNLPSLSKDQYRLSMDLSQTIYRGGVTEYLKEMDLIALEIYNLTTDKELYEIKSVAKNYFFQILILDKQRQIVQSYQKLLNEKYKEIDVWVKEGMAWGS